MVGGGVSVRILLEMIVHHMVVLRILLILAAQLTVASLDFIKKFLFVRLMFIVLAIHKHFSSELFQFMGS